MPQETSEPETRPAPPSSAMTPPAAFGALVMQSWIELGTDTMRFAYARWQDDMKTQKALLACTSPDEFRKIQTEFLVRAQKSYTAELGKRLTSWVKTTEAGLSAIRSRRRYDDVPL